MKRKTHAAANGHKNNHANKKLKNNNHNNSSTSSKTEKQYNKRNPLLLAGTKGFLFTCDTIKQREAVREAYNLLDEYIEILYPSLLKQDVGKVLTPTNEGVDINSKPKSMHELLQAEIKSMQNKSKNKTSSSQQYIKKLDSGAAGLILMVCTNTDDVINPVEMAEKICSDMLKTKRQRSRFLIRIQPYEIGGSTDEKELVNSLNILLKRKPVLLHSKQEGCSNNDNRKKTSYKIVYKRRNHDKSLRNTILKLADEVDEKYHTVDLKRPDNVILLNIVKGTSFLSILPYYTKLNEYNFRKIIGK